MARKKQADEAIPVSFKLPVMPQPTDGYVCEYCRKKFTRYVYFERHECKQMALEKLTKSREGMIAYSLYKTWQLLHHRPIPPIEVAVRSKIFKSFIKFNEFAKRMSLANIERYMRFMVKRKYDISVAEYPEVYADYILYIDTELTPMQHVKTTVSNLLNLATAKDVKFVEVFDYLTVPDIIQGVTTRRYSPWLLLLSSKFRDRMLEYTEQQQQLLATALDIEGWVVKFKKYPKEVSAIKHVLQQMGI